MTSTNYYGIPVPMYRCLLTGEVNDFYDEDGRPIGEVRASDSVRQTVTTEYRVCPYPGSRVRSGLPMNLSALRQAAREWSRMMGTVAWIRAAYLERYPSTEVTLLEFARIAAAGLMLPAYLLFREPNCLAGGRVPTFVSSVHRMLAGVFSVSKNLLISQVAMGNQFDRIPADGSRLAEFAEHSGMLIGNREEVCAGSQGMIEEVLNLIADGTLKGEPDRESIQLILPDTDRFLDYAEAVGDVTFWMLVTALRAQELVTTLTGQLERGNGWDWYKDAWTATEPVRTAFHAGGFGVHAWPMLRQLTAETVEAMVRGVTPLFRGLETTDFAGPLFQRDWPEGTSDEQRRVVAWLSELNPGSEGWLEAGMSLVRCLEAEQDALRLFGRLQVSIHRALGRLLPDPAADGAMLCALFGMPASKYFETLFGIQIAMSSGSVVLSRDMGRRRLVIRGSAS